MSGLERTRAARLLPLSVAGVAGLLAAVSAYGDRAGYLLVTAAEMLGLVLVGEPVGRGRAHRARAGWPAPLRTAPLTTKGTGRSRCPSRDRRPAAAG